MDARDVLGLSLGALRAHRLRSVLSALGVAVGVAAVTLLTSIGQGVHGYVRDEFLQFGTNVLEVTPGSTETVGIPGVLGGSTRQLTIEDAVAIGRLPGVERSMPLAMGQARVEAGERGRSVYVYGGTSELPDIWRFGVRQGSFLPPGDPTRGGQVAVLGPTLKRELFGDANALGELVRIAGTRFRVIGVMAPRGRLLGFDVDDAAYVPVATAMRIFNLEEVLEVEVVYDPNLPVAAVERDVRALMIARHGDEDFTITTQTAMLDVLDRVLGVLTSAVGAIAGVSLLVGAIGILTMMWIAVGERRAEIGLERALGATAAQVQRLFLAEAAFLSALGGLAGLAAGLGGAQALGALVPALPVRVPWLYVALALALSLATGLAAGQLPARRAAALEPVTALKEE